MVHPLILKDHLHNVLTSVKVHFSFHVIFIFPLSFLYNESQETAKNMTQGHIYLNWYADADTELL